MPSRFPSPEDKVSQAHGYVFASVDAYREVSDEKVDAESLKAGVKRVFDKKKRSAGASYNKAPEANT